MLAARGSPRLRVYALDPGGTCVPRWAGRSVPGRRTSATPEPETVLPRMHRLIPARTCTAPRYTADEKKASTAPRPGQGKSRRNASGGDARRHRLPTGGRWPPAPAEGSRCELTDRVIRAPGRRRPWGNQPRDGVGCWSRPASEGPGRHPPREVLLPAAVRPGALLVAATYLRPPSRQARQAAGVTEDGASVESRAHSVHSGPGPPAGTDRTGGSPATAFRVGGFWRSASRPGRGSGWGAGPSRPGRLTSRAPEAPLSLGGFEGDKIQKNNFQEEGKPDEA